MKAYSKAKKQEYPDWALQRAEIEGLAYPDYINAADKVNFYKKVSWVNIAVNAVSTVGSGAKWNVKRTKGEDLIDVPNHDFERLITHPNPTMSRKSLIFATLAYMSVTNTAYWWLNIVNGRPVEIWLVPNKQISPIPDGNMYIQGYDYDPGDGQLIRLTPQEIVPFIGFNPDSMFEGFSNLDPLRTVANSDLGMQKWNEKLFVKSNGRLPGILAFADPIQDDDWKTIQDDVSKAAAMRNFMMLRNVRAGGVQWLQATASQKDMEFLNSRLANRDEIYSSVAPGLASLLSVNASLDNARTGKATLIDLKVYPMLQEIGDVVTNAIMPMYGDKFVFEPEDIRITDKVLLFQEIETYSKTHKVNEVRQKYWQTDPIEDEIGEMLVSVAQTVTANIPEAETTTPEPVYQQPPAIEMPEDEQNPEVDDMETRAEFQPVKADIYPAMLELEKWERKASRKNGKVDDFVAYNIPLDVVTAIKAGMSFADARIMLQGQPDKPKEENKELGELVRALDLSLRAMEISASQPKAAKQEPMSLTIHNHPGEKPEVKADINVPPPVINFSPVIQPSTAQTVVENNITAVSGETTVTAVLPEGKKKRARVTRGPDNKINGIDEL